MDRSKFQILFFVRCLIMISIINIPVLAGDFPKELKVYHGNTPVLDGKISPGEYDDATRFSGTIDWTHEFNVNSNSTDLSVEAWVKHDGKHLYFAFDVTDDVVYGIDIPRWFPDGNNQVHEFTPDKGKPWFGDGIEIFLNPQNKWDVNKNETAWGDGRCWMVVCSTHKSLQNKLEKGGLIEGEPKNDVAWNVYKNWIKSGAMKASVRIKPKSEGSGYVIEWEIAAKPCLEIKKGKYWNPKMGVVKMGLNFEIQDLDEKERGTGNWANMHHVDVWAGKKGEKRAIKNWGSLVIYPDYKPANLNSCIKLTD